MLRCAIIGCGNIAGGYDNSLDDKIRTHVKAFKRHKNCELVGVCDNNIEIGKKFASYWECSYFTTDPARLIQECKPDLLSICTPTETHEYVFKLACVESVPCVWLEKPVALSLSAVKRMKNLASSTGTKVWVNYFRRYDSGFNSIKQTLPSLGSIHHVRILYTKGIKHNGSHLIDLVLWFFGKIENVRINKIQDDDLFPSVSAVFDTESVSIDIVALDYKKYELFEMDIIGENGRIKVLDGGQEIVFETVVEGKYYDGYRNLSTSRRHTGSYSKFMAEGLSLGLSGKSMPSIDDEIAIQKVLLKIEDVSLEFKNARKIEKINFNDDAIVS